MTLSRAAAAKSHAGAYAKKDLLRHRREGYKQLYLSLGPSRTLDRARRAGEQTLGEVSYQTIKVWCRSYGWVQAAAEFDASATELVIRADELSLVELEKLSDTDLMATNFRSVMLRLAEAVKRYPARDVADAQRYATILKNCMEMFGRLTDPDGPHAKQTILHKHQHQIVDGPARSELEQVRAAASVVYARVLAREKAIDVPSTPVPAEPVAEPVPAPLPAPPPPPTSAPGTSSPFMDIRDAAKAAAATSGRQTIAEILAQRSVVR